MNIRERFLDFWGDDVRGDLSVFEKLIYGAFGITGGILFAIILVIGLPVWSVPYLVYKHFKLKTGN